MEGAVTVGTIIGGLIGVVSLLLKLVVAAKNEQIKMLEDQVEEVTKERDLFRDLILSGRGEGSHHRHDD